jgi:hypothetical protein
MDKFEKCDAADQVEMKKLAPWKVPETYVGHKELNNEAPYQYILATFGVQIPGMDEGELPADQKAWIEAWDKKFTVFNLDN